MQQPIRSPSWWPKQWCWLTFVLVASCSVEVCGFLNFTSISILCLEECTSDQVDIKGSAGQQATRPACHQTPTRRLIGSALPSCTSEARDDPAFASFSTTSLRRFSLHQLAGCPPEAPQGGGAKRREQLDRLGSTGDDARLLVELVTERAISHR